MEAAPAPPGGSQGPCRGCRHGMPIPLETPPLPSSGCIADLIVGRGTPGGGGVVSPPLPPRPNTSPQGLRTSRFAFRGARRAK
eukprot:3711574-Pyramimonas_sp.AAC.2